MKTFMFIGCIAMAIVAMAMFFVALYLSAKYENNAFIMGGILSLFVSVGMWVAAANYGKE